MSLLTSELKDELKELKNSIAGQLDRIKTLKAGRKEKESIAWPSMPDSRFFTGRWATGSGAKS